MPPTDAAERDARLRAAFQHAPDGMALIEPDGTLLAVGNPAAMASSFSGRVPLKETVAMERCMYGLPMVGTFLLGKLLA